MEQIASILWVILGVGLIVAEIFTLGFVLFWFGIGAFAAGLTGFLGFGFAWQFLVFAVVSTALTAMSRTIFSNYFSHTEENTIKTGVDALPGKVGTVSAASRGALHEGAVKVFGSTWTAYPIDEETPLLEGEKVEVVAVKGSSIYVRKVTAEKELAEWRKPQS
ncbi:MAG: NfeD family protein [Acidobacteria bacterium]|nr:NfeD family protein [Acidobacteriota bacterium]